MNIAILEVIADRIIELLHEHGPLDEAELLDELAADAMDCPADLFERLYSYEGLLPLVRLLDDGRYCAADMILSGRTFTHRLTEAEIAGDYLELDADLHGALNLDEDVRYQHLVDDGLFRHVMPRFDGELLADREIAMTPANRSLVWVSSWSPSRKRSSVRHPPVCRLMFSSSWRSTRAGPAGSGRS